MIDKSGALAASWGVCGAGGLGGGVWHVGDFRGVVMLG